MKIKLNGEDYNVKEAGSIAGLLSELNLAGQRVAVMVNGEIVKKDQRQAVEVKEGDTVEVISMVGGG